jgi:hypothetical protein
MSLMLAASWLGPDRPGHGQTKGTNGRSANEFVVDKKQKNDQQEEEAERSKQR